MNRRRAPGPPYGPYGMFEPYPPGILGHRGYPRHRGWQASLALRRGVGTERRR